MKKCVAQNVAKVTGMIGGLAVASASAAVHANAAEGIYIVPSVTYQWFEDDYEDINDDVSLGFALGRQLTDSWGIELAYNLTATEFDKDTKLGDVDAEYVHIDAIYTAPAFNPGSAQPWSSYVVFGVGSMDYEAENKNSSFKDDTTWNLGVGLQNDITPSLAFRTDLRSVMVKDNMLGAYFNVGMVYAFGEAQSKPAPVKAAPARLPRCLPNQ